MSTEDVVLDIDETEETRSKVSLDIRAINSNALNSVQDGKIYVRSMHFCINNNIEEQYDVVAMRRCDLKHLIGTDQVMQYRRGSEESREFKERFEKAVLKHVASLERIANEKNITDTQKTVILKMTDAVWQALAMF